MAAPVLLAPFGTGEGENWFRNAYKWNRDQIFAWMERVTRGEAGGPQSADATTREVLAAIYGNIRKLSLPDGLIYRATGIQPNSHIVRLLNRAWGNGSNQELSKFLVGAWPFAPASDRDGRVPGWFNPYDLLGLFLSLLGPTSEAADQENYFLPLTAVYARWCTRIAGNKPGRWKWKPTDPGVGDWPFMFQCTWNLIEDSNKKRSHWFFLGASTAGDKFDANAVGGWRREVQRERFGMLFGCQRQPLVQRMDFEENKAPSQLMPGGSQVPYGNCAETYPFVAMVQADTTKNESLHGLALRRNFMEAKKEPEYSDDHAQGKFSKNLVVPCPNCTRLIENAGGVTSQFGLVEEDE